MNWVLVDFDGHSLNGTEDPLDVRYTTTSSGYTIVQQKEVLEVLDSLYAPFNIRFTTDPTVYANAGTYGGRLIIGEYAGFNGNPPLVGVFGNARQNSFGDGKTNAIASVAWNSGNGIIQSPTSVGLAAAHEIGHTLGLNHKGLQQDATYNPNYEYYSGHSVSGSSSNWSPIMGVPNNPWETFYQWSKGDYKARLWSSGAYTYRSANQQVDEIAVLGSKLGFRPDDYSDTLTGAPLKTLNSGYITVGLINNRTDVDVFKFNHTGGNIDILVNPTSNVYQLGKVMGVYNNDLFSPLNIRTDLLNSSGIAVASSDPTNSKSANIFGSFTAGTYYLRVDGVGQGDFTSGLYSTGFDDYGSIGNYVISGLG